MTLTMKYNMRLMGHVTCGSAALSLSLLVIGFVTPGWLVVKVTPKDTSIWNLQHKDRDMTVYIGVWFSRLCSHVQCITTSIHEGMVQSEQNMEQKHLSNRLTWNVEIQAEAIITLLCSLVGVVMLVIFTKFKSTKKGLGVAALLSVLVSAKLVLIVTLKMSALNNQMESYIDNELHFEVWTPYSIAIIGTGGIMAYVTSLFCIIMICAQNTKKDRMIKTNDEEKTMQSSNLQQNGHCIQSYLNGYSVIMQDIPVCNTVKESATIQSFG